MIIRDKHIEQEESLTLKFQHVLLATCKLRNALELNKRSYS